MSSNTLYLTACKMVHLRRKCSIFSSSSPHSWHMVSTWFWLNRAILACKIYCPLTTFNFIGIRFASLQVLILFWYRSMDVVYLVCIFLYWGNLYSYIILTFQSYNFSNNYLLVHIIVSSIAILYMVILITNIFLENIVTRTRYLSAYGTKWS